MAKNVLCKKGTTHRDGTPPKVKNKKPSAGQRRRAERGGTTTRKGREDGEFFWGTGETGAKKKQLTPLSPKNFEQGQLLPVHNGWEDAFSIDSSGRTVAKMIRYGGEYRFVPVSAKGIVVFIDRKSVADLSKEFTEFEVLKLSESSLILRPNVALTSESKASFLLAREVDIGTRIQVKNPQDVLGAPSPKGDSEIFKVRREGDSLVLLSGEKQGLAAFMPVKDLEIFYQGSFQHIEVVNVGGKTLFIRPVAAWYHPTPYAGGIFIDL